MSRKAKSSSASAGVRRAKVDVLLRRHDADEDITEHHHRRRRQQQVVGLHDLRQAGGKFAAECRARYCAQAEQSVEPLGFPRVEDIGRHQPGLRDHHDAEQADPDVEDVQHPVEIEAQQPPDRQQAPHRDSRGPIHRCRQRGTNRHLAYRR